MGKTFAELKVGDDIYYYDHCKLHKQKVTSIEIVKGKEVIYKDFFGREWKRTEDDELVIKAGKGTIIKIWYIHYLNSDTIKYNRMPRFSNYEAGLTFIDNLKNKHIKRMKKYYNKYLKEKRIVERYSNKIMDNSDNPISGEFLIKNGFEKDYNPYTKEDVYHMDDFPFVIVYDPYYKKWYGGFEVVTKDEDYNVEQFSIQTINDLYNIYKFLKINKELLI